MEHKTPAKSTVGHRKPWAGDLILREARSRIRRLNNENNIHMQEMLKDLLLEAGWTNDQFLQALTKDVIANGRDRWTVPAASIAPAPPAGLEAERRGSPRHRTARPPPTKSGTMARVSPSMLPGAKSKAG